MADFAETMRQWKRMCDTMGREYADSHTECDHCTLGECPAIWETPKNTDWDAIADKVLAWAKENPERLAHMVCICRSGAAKGGEVG